VWTLTKRQLPPLGGRARLLWDYSDNDHFYYFVAKTNGWELGKRDPAYAGSQRFLATGTALLFPIGAWYRIRVVQSGKTMKVSVNDAPIVAFIDLARPYPSGRLGLYSEETEVYFDNVSITTDSPAQGKGKKKCDAKNRAARHTSFCLETLHG
jgi:hypothetical protein